MSDIIHLLPDSVANQIAAGEVIQRPASVVKELVENAIDAEAREVHVLVADAGKTSIQVIDDGKGMSETDARLSFERHATSKIREAADLFALHTMGFRGEALASIAAVAEVELKTRRAEDELGTRLLIAGSKVESQEPVNCPRGSNFLVKNLFFNVPARRKFLKSNSTELSNIMTEFERIALVHPSVSFSLLHNDAELLNLPAMPLRQRVMAVFGKKMNQQLLTLEVETTLVKISGFVAKPETARKKGAHQYFFVNGRYMRHPYFHKAVMEAYERLIPAGEQVSYFIYFDVDPKNIDVNIHPTKTEIKFENEIDFDTEDMPDLPTFNGTASCAPPKVSYDSGFDPFKSATAPSYGGDTRARSVSGDWEQLYAGVARASKMNEPAADLLPDEEELAGTVLPVEEPMVEKGALHFQLKGRFILTSVKSGLMLIDQHRAHVRVLFDKYMEQIRTRKGVSQGVLFPEVVELTPAETVVLDALSDDLAAVGFDLSPLGGGSYAVNRVPAGIEGLSPVDLIRNMVHTAQEKGADVREEVQSILALTLARSAAIVYGQALSEEEMANLVDSLFACQTPGYTPDGRTVLITVKEEEIEKRFA